MTLAAVSLGASWCSAKGPSSQLAILKLPVACLLSAMFDHASMAARTAVAPDGYRVVARFGQPPRHCRRLAPPGLVDTRQERERGWTRARSRHRAGCSTRAPASAA